MTTEPARPAFAAATLTCLLGACTAMGMNDSDRRYTGVVERTQQINRAGEPSAALMAFGAIGGLMYHGASQPTATNLYFVRTNEGELVTVQVDEEWPVGSCVDVIPLKGAIGGGSYAYGQARVAAADKCAPPRSDRQ